MQLSDGGGEIGIWLRELIRQTCEAQEVYIKKGHIAVDHVHLLLLVPPNIAASDLVQKLKGRSIRKMLDEFGELRRQFWGQHQWARGYFLASSGNVTDEVRAQYIGVQTEKPQNDDENFQIGGL